GMIIFFYAIRLGGESFVIDIQPARTRIADLHPNGRSAGTSVERDHKWTGSLILDIRPLIIRIEYAGDGFPFLIPYRHGARCGVVWDTLPFNGNFPMSSDSRVDVQGPAAGGQLLHRRRGR